MADDYERSNAKQEVRTAADLLREVAEGKHKAAVINPGRDASKQVAEEARREWRRKGN